MVPRCFPAIDEALACKLPHGWCLQELSDDEDGRLFESDVDVLKKLHGAIDRDDIRGVALLCMQGSVAVTREVL